jgi:hypothetical protein
MAWLNISGLILTIIGTIFLSFGLIINKKTALHLGMAKWGGTKEEDNLKLPQVQNLIKQSRNTVIGLSLLFIGFILQTIANWPIQ